MRNKRMIALAAVGAAAASVLAASPVGAQEGELAPLDVAPLSGPAGTVITVKGDDCQAHHEGEEHIIPVVEAIFVDYDAETILDAASVEGGETSGEWSLTLTVPDDIDPEGVYAVTATCWDDIEEEIILTDYDIYEFDVTGTSTPPPTPTTTPPANAPPPPATPVVEEPPFTG